MRKTVDTRPLFLQGSAHRARIGPGYEARYVYAISFLYSNLVLFQLHGCVVSHMQVLATPLLSVHIIKYSFCWILTEQKFISDCRYRVIESSSLVFREVFSHPYISLFHLLVNGFCVTRFRTFFADPLSTFLILVDGIGGRGGIEMASASTPSANKPAKDLILVSQEEWYLVV